MRALAFARMMVLSSSFSSLPRSYPTNVTSGSMTPFFGSKQASQARTLQYRFEQESTYATERIAYGGTGRQRVCTGHFYDGLYNISRCEELSQMVQSRALTQKKTHRAAF